MRRVTVCVCARCKSRTGRHSTGVTWAVLSIYRVHLFRKPHHYTSKKPKVGNKWEIPLSQIPRVTWHVTLCIRRRHRTRGNRESAATSRTLKYKDWKCRKAREYSSVSGSARKTGSPATMRHREDHSPRTAEASPPRASNKNSKCCSSMLNSFSACT